MIAGGSFAVQAGQMGIPLVSYDFFLWYLGITPPVLAFCVYGGLAGVMGSALGGKSL